MTKKNYGISMSVEWIGDVGCNFNLVAEIFLHVLGMATEIALAWSTVESAYKLEYSLLSLNRHLYETDT